MKIITKNTHIFRQNFAKFPIRYFNNLFHRHCFKQSTKRIKNRSLKANKISFVFYLGHITDSAVKLTAIV